MARKPAFISHSREREAQIQSRMLDVLEAMYPIPFDYIDDSYWP